MSRVFKRYSGVFKEQIVSLVNNGKLVSEVVLEYKICKSTVNKWVKDFNNSGSFCAKDNISAKDLELKQLRKELSYAKMEIDILKQAALIMGQK